MNEFLIEATKKSDELMNCFDDTVKKCEGLAAGMGEKLTEKFTLCHFWEMLDNVKV